MLLVHTVQGVDRRMKEGPGRGRIAVIGLVADPPGVRQREVGAHGWDPVAAASCVKIMLSVKSIFSMYTNHLRAKSLSEQLVSDQAFLSPHTSQAFHLPYQC